MRRMSLYSLTLIGAACIAGWSSAIAAETGIGRQIGEFSLRDFRGKVHALADYADSKVVVVAFTNVAEVRHTVVIGVESVIAPGTGVAVVGHAVAVVVDRIV